MNCEPGTFLKRALAGAMFLPALVLCLSACQSNIKDEKTAPRDKPAAGAEEKHSGAAFDKGRPDDAQPVIPRTLPSAKKIRTPGNLLANLPCRLDGKQGVFAVFPDNPVSGQNCFSLFPARENIADAPTFDIRGGAMYIIFHAAAGAAPGDVTLMRWENRGGGPCLDAACGKALAVKTETCDAPGNSGLTCAIITPAETADLSSANAGYYGVVMKGAQYLPLFY